MSINKIYIVKGKGIGKTKKSAFDKALKDAGIHNANLIEISSIIPEGTEDIVFINKYNLKKYGNKLYVVISKCISKKKAVSGLAVVFDKEKRKGIILEEFGNSEKEVEKKLIEGIKEMLEYRDIKGNLDIYIESCENDQEDFYVCSIVVAIYKEEDW